MVNSSIDSTDSRSGKPLGLPSIHSNSPPRGSPTISVGSNPYNIKRVNPVSKKKSIPNGGNHILPQPGSDLAQGPPETSYSSSEVQINAKGQKLSQQQLKKLNEKY